MKKSIIAAGAASVALAAMPIVSTFAAVTPVHDNINAVLSSGCMINDAVAEKTVNLSMAPGSVATSPAAASISVTCNNSTWKITAKGTGSTAGHATDLAQTKDASGDPIAEPTQFIATGTETSGDNSQWAFKVASISDTTHGSVVAAYNNTFAAIPSDATPIVTGSAAATETVNTQYQVYASISQAGGTYTGQVEYTVAES